MELDVTPWLNLAIRWLHFIAGIAWIGSSFYFVWLDNHLQPPKDKTDSKKGVSGELWSVHGGGFYHKQKYAVAPPAMPDELHWFKWEAYTTWLSGFALLALIYYAGAEIYLIDPGKYPFTKPEAILVGAAFIAGGWLVYDGLCKSPIGQNSRIFGAIWFLFLTACAYALTQLFNDRGAFIHVGAMIGTVMVANVFFVIIPNQRVVVADLVAGKTPDPALGLMGKQRSLHNNYMTLPVLFLMISNHYPMTFSGPYNWVILAGLGITGILIRHFFNLRHKGTIAPMLPFAAAVLFVGLMIFSGTVNKGPVLTAEVPTLTRVQQIVNAHCVNCHAAQPMHDAFEAAPAGVMLTSPALIQRYAGKIYQQAIASNIMPLGNETGMTPEERAALGAWIKSQD